MRAPTHLLLLASAAALQPLAPTQPTQPTQPVKPAEPAQPVQPAAPAWAAYVKPDAVEAMRRFFEKDARGLRSGKSLISLAQGKNAEGVAAPQLAKAFAPPPALLAPPSSATLEVWKNYNLLMVGFWYRFKFGFAIYKQLTKETGKWVDCAVKYFDLIANGFFSMYAFLSLYQALEALKNVSWSDPKTHGVGYASWVRVRLAYALMWWLFHQSANSLFTIEETLGAIPVASQARAYFAKWTPWTLGWAFMHWEVEADLASLALLYDGAAWDAPKANRLAAAWWRKKLALDMRGIFYALVGEAMPQWPMLANAVPWLGYSVSWDALAVSYHTGLALAAPAGQAKAAHALAGQAETVVATQNKTVAATQNKTVVANQSAAAIELEAQPGPFVELAAHNRARASAVAMATAA